LRDGINNISVYAAYEFSLVPEGERKELRQACLDQALLGLGGNAEDLRGVGVLVVEHLIRHMLCGGTLAICCKGKHQRVNRMLCALRLIIEYNKTREVVVEELSELLLDLDLCELPAHSLKSMVEPSGLVPPERLLQLCADKSNEEAERVNWRQSNGMIYDVNPSKWPNYVAKKTYDLEHLLVFEPGVALADSVIERYMHVSKMTGIAVHGVGRQQRIAIVNNANHRVVMLNPDPYRCWVHVTSTSRSTTAAVHLFGALERAGQGMHSLRVLRGWHALLIVA
jgi:hypothetical protein